MCVVKFLQVKVVKSDKAMGTVYDLREFLDNSIMLLLVAVHVCWLHSVRTKTNWKQQLEIEYAIAHASLELFCVDGVEYCYFDSALLCWKLLNATLYALSWPSEPIMIMGWLMPDNTRAMIVHAIRIFLSLSLSLFLSVSILTKREKNIQEKNKNLLFNSLSRP